MATQKVVETALAKQGKRRADMTREELLAEAWKWKEHHHTRIVEQSVANREEAAPAAASSGATAT